MHANKGQLQWWEGQHGDGQACRICREVISQYSQISEEPSTGYCEQWRCSVIVREGQASGFFSRRFTSLSPGLLLSEKKCGCQFRIREYLDSELISLTVDLEDAPWLGYRGTEQVAGCPALQLCLMQNWGVACGSLLLLARFPFLDYWAVGAVR